MFRQRLFTTLLIIPFVLYAIYYGSFELLSLIIVALILICGWEWLQLIPLTQLLGQMVFILILPFMVAFIGQFFIPSLIAGLLLWSFILWAVITYPKSEPVWGHPVIVGGMGLLLLPLFANSLIALFHQPFGRHLLVYLLCLVWAADIGAYIAGKIWGQHKLIPLVSPGKTIEGTLGGLVLVLIVAAVGQYGLHPAKPWLWYGLTLTTALVSILGDLFISVLKRRSKLKDTGNILPGHGGILDRLDSLIAAAPYFYIGFLYGF